MVFRLVKWVDHVRACHSLCDLVGGLEEERVVVGGRVVHGDSVHALARVTAIVPS